MIVKNKYLLPDGLVEIVESQLHPPNPDRFSVTHIIGPPLIRTLQIKHWNEIEVDVSDYLWMLLGSAVDKLISSAKKGSAIRQHRMEQKIDGHTIVGVADVINEDVLADWKCTSVWSFLNGVKAEWEAQLNIYNYLLWLERKGNGNVPIRFLKIYAILRDWQAGKSYDKSYPQIPFQTEFVRQWTNEQQLQYIQSRLKDHIDNSERECTDDEKWRSKTTWAVKKEGRKSAMRVLDTEKDATEWQLHNGGDSIEERKGECKRCRLYCPVKSVCKYAKEK